MKQSARRIARRELPLMKAAARGAVAGLMGGVAMTVVDRAVMPRTGGRTPDRHEEAFLAREARRAGMRLPLRPRVTRSLAATLAYSALLGAVYGMAYSRLRHLGAASRMLDAGLVHAATLMVGDPRKVTRGVGGVMRHARGSRAVMRQASGPAVFGRATATAFRMLAR